MTKQSIPPKADRAKRERLTDREVAAFKPGAKRRRESDENGLFLWIWPNGTKSWRVAYWIDGRKHEHGLGSYPSMSLAQARAARLEVRKMVKAGRDPNRDRRTGREAAQAAGEKTFEVVARNWHATKSRQDKWAPLTAKQIWLRLKRHALPKIGDRSIAAIDDELIEEFLCDVHSKVPAVAEKLRKDLCPIFDYAIRKRLTATNPVRVAAPDLPVHSDGQKDPSVKTIEDARIVVHAVERTNLMPPVLLYHRLIALTGVRESVARLAEWSEFATAGEWAIPAERMKGKRGNKRGLTLPLSRQAEEVVAAARALFDQTGGPGGDLVFRSLMGKRQACAPYTLNSAMKPALRKAGIVDRNGRVAHVPHGWRATFSTVMNSRHKGKSRPIVEAILGHVVAGVAGDYDHSAGIIVTSDEARAIVQEWADLLLERESSAFALIGLPAPSNVVPFPRPAASPRVVAPAIAVAEPRAAAGLRRRLRSPQV